MFKNGVFFSAIQRDIKCYNDVLVKNNSILQNRLYHFDPYISQSKLHKT